MILYIQVLQCVFPNNRCLLLSNYDVVIYFINLTLVQYFIPSITCIPICQPNSIVYNMSFPSSTYCSLVRNYICHVFLTSFNLKHFHSFFFLSFMTLAFLRITVTCTHCFCKIGHSLFCLMFHHD